MWQINELCKKTLQELLQEPPLGTFLSLVCYSSAHASRFNLSCFFFSFLKHSESASWWKVVLSLNIFCYISGNKSIWSQINHQTGGSLPYLLYLLSNPKKKKPAPMSRDISGSAGVLCVLALTPEAPLPLSSVFLLPHFQLSTLLWYTIVSGVGFLCRFRIRSRGGKTGGGSASSGLMVRLRRF